MEEKKLTGSSVNYYFIEVPEPKRLPSYTAEVEDLVEVLDMEFAEGNLLKGLVRLCKLRQNARNSDIKVKYGSTELYEAEKIKYYADRVLAKAQKRDKNKG